MKTVLLQSSRLVSVVLFMLYGMSMFAQRQDILLNNDWNFRFSHQVQKGTEVRVDLPHTWNAQDALSGKIDYKRGIGNYEKNLFIRPEWKGKRLFIRFEGVNNIADVFINRRHIGEHRGGYGAFIFEITGKVEYGKENSILVRVNNGEQLDIMPLVGDFNFYGGIYRDVHLLITDETCISPLDYASPGVRLIQDSVSHRYAKVRAIVDLSNGSSGNQEVELNVRLLDGQRVVKEGTKNVNLSGNEVMQQELTFEIDQPHLWNGRQDPFLYQAEVTLFRNGQMVDRVTQPLGLRFYRIDPDKGFFLNGKHLPLQGVCRHQDRSEVGNALRPQHHEEDVALMLEMGVNAVRLAHYPQATYFYDLMDKNGIIVWAEIPFVGPGGYNDKGFVDLPAFRANGKEQLKELIRQHYNHLSICVWGLFNELTELGDNPVEYIKELNVLAHQEDTTRPTTSASNQMGDLNFITDAIAWNRYDGWYGGTPADLGKWLDRCIRIIRKYVLLSVNMVPAQVFTINKIRWLKLYQPVGGILKTGRRIITLKTGKQSLPVLMYGGALSGICLILALHIALKETVPELMIKVWLPSTGKFVKMLSTSIRPTGIGKNQCFI